MITTRAILGRFGFNKRKAIQYCQTLARTYPLLSAEYLGHIDIINAMPEVEALEELNG
jgi:hypothetical protein